MGIPVYYEMYKAILHVLADGQEHTLNEVYGAVAKEFHLTDDEMAQQIPSGQQVYKNRAGWARTYLKKAGLISSPKRSVFAITDEGKRVLEENPEPLDNQYLTRYESFRTFASSSAKKKDSSDEPDSQMDSQTPDDLLEESYEKITGNLAEELLAEVVKVSPTTFEQLVIDLLRKMGYGTFENAGKTTVASGDEGIDGVIMEDKLGFSLIYIQAKKWDLDSTVGRPAIQNFVGAISGKGGKGLFVTTAKFSAPAIEYAEQQHIILVDGKKLARLMIEHNFCVSVKRTFEIKAIDTDGINEYLE